MGQQWDQGRNQKIPWSKSKSVGHWESIQRWKFIASQVYQKKKAQINNLISYLKEPENEQQTKPKVSKRKEIIKIKVEINAIESRKMIQKINESKSWFFEKINKIGKL